MSSNDDLDDVFDSIRRTEASLNSVTPEYIRQQYAAMQQKITDAIAELENDRNRPNGQPASQA